MGYYIGGDAMYGRGDYYRGDYYRGDYYRGDPGLLGSLFKGAKALAGAAFRATPVGSAISLAGGILRGSAPATGSTPLAATPAPQFSMSGMGGIRVPSPMGPVAMPGTPGNPGMAIVRGPMVAQESGPGPYGMTVMGTPGTKPSPYKMAGYHVNRSGYYRRTPGGNVAYIERGSAWVRNRSMNPTNGRALRKALTRAYAFQKIALRTIKLVSPTKKAKKFGGFKKKGGHR